jgi:Flp pilus assembly protein TadG
MKRLLQRFRRNKRGVNAIEFAFVGPITLFLLFGICEVMLVFLANTVLDASVTRASRLIRTGQVATTGMNETQFKQVVCDRLFGIIDCNGVFIDVQSFPGFIGITPNNPAAGGTLQQSSMTFGATNPGDTVIVRAFYAYRLHTPVLMEGLENYGDGKRLLVATATFRNEPWGS